MKGYSTFPKAPASLEPHHQTVLCHIQGTHWWGDLTPLQRCSQCISLGVGLVLWHINLCRLFNTKSTLVEGQVGEWGVHTLLKSMSWFQTLSLQCCSPVLLPLCHENIPHEYRHIEDYIKDISCPCSNFPLLIPSILSKGL